MTQWTKKELEGWCLGWCRTPHTTLKAFIDAGFCSDQEPSREEMRLLRKRPDEPSVGAKDVRYRGWECGYNTEAALWGAEGWEAYLGGPDIDAPKVSARTWAGLLDEIDAHDLTGEQA